MKRMVIEKTYGEKKRVERHLSKNKDVEKEGRQSPWRVRIIRE